MRKNQENISEFGATPRITACKLSRRTSLATFTAFNATDSLGTRTAKLKAEPRTYDARLRPWYKEAVAANKPMTSIYPGFTPGTVFIAASQPIRDRNGKLLGVCAVDFSLSELEQYLDGIKLSKTGEIFAIERSRLLIASLSQESPFRKMSGKQQALLTEYFREQNSHPWQRNRVFVRSLRGLWRH